MTHGYIEQCVMVAEVVSFNLQDREGKPSR